MRVLFILPEDFPYSGSCTSLINNLFDTDVFLNTDHQIAVLSLGYGTITPSIETLKLKNVDVYRTYIRRGISIQECKRKIFRNPWKVLQVLAHKTCSRMSRCIREKAISTAEVAEIVHKIECIGMDQFDVLVPVLGNICIAAAALKIKKADSTKKLVLYQVDPCSTNEGYPAFMKKELTQFEEELYTAADRIVTTAILLREAQEKYADEILDKMTAMEFPNVVSNPVVSQPNTAGYKNCVFTGSIYGNIRNPEYTFRLFHNLDDQISLKIMGVFSDKVKEKCEKYGIVAYGWKTLQETREEIAASHILVNIGNSMLNQVPSKLFEYISFGKPIVNICKNRNCPTLAYLEHYPYALNLFEEEDLLEEQRIKLRHFINENYNKLIPFGQIRKEYETSTPQYCAGQMMNIFDELSP